MKKTLISVAIATVAMVASTNTYAWGQNGHRVVGKIAESHLTETTAKAISPLLNGDKLAEVTTWADEMRSNPSNFWKKQSPRWHYVNMSDVNEFKPESYDIADSHGDVKDAYAAMLKAISVLKSETASLEEKQFYFRFLTHIVGDIHQPMHVGRKDDRGGNRIKVQFFGEETNLHSLWDTALVENQNLSYTELADFINTSDNKQISKMLDSEPQEWVVESFHIAQELYQTGEGKFSYDYVYQYSPVMKKRLLEGGVRLAGLLNLIFDKQAKVQVNALGKLEPTKK